MTIKTYLVLIYFKTFKASLAVKIKGLSNKPNLLIMPTNKLLI